MGGAGVTVTTASVRGQRHLGCEAKQTRGTSRARLPAELCSPATARPWGSRQGRPQDAQAGPLPSLGSTWQPEPSERGCFLRGQMSDV